MSHPLVSVVTPTWNRPDLLAETIAHVREQDYPTIEHVVVHDGQTDDLTPFWSELGPPRGALPGVLMRRLELGRNFSGLWPESFGVAPLTVGMLVARGEYLMPWCDDERALVPDHISRLVDLLESSGADFVYPRCHIWRNGDPDGPETAIIGTDPPRSGQITHWLFRRDLLRRAMPRWGSHPCDWALISDWMAAGATWAMLDDCTFSHRLDQ